MLLFIYKKTFIMAKKLTIQIKALAGVAQLVEQWIENPRVTSSILVPGIKIHKNIPGIKIHKNVI